jgi:hypothetical protein
MNLIVIYAVELVVFQSVMKIPKRQAGLVWSDLFWSSLVFPSLKVRYIFYILPDAINI